ncbi:MAG: hypothetical protein FJ098_05910 [Deltaproteobacteria bacterium]|nr:hypothetical protein [Deltaproteobacteria bacterium]
MSVTGPVDRSEALPREEAVVAALFLLERTLRSHGASHPLARQVAARAGQSFHEAGLPFTLQFVGGGLFRDMALIPVSLRTYKQVVELSKTLRHLGVDELTFEQVPALSDLVRFGEALGQGAVAASDALAGVRIGGLSWRTIEGIRWGLDRENVDPEIYASAQVGLAVAEAEELVATRDGPWRWTRGLAVVRRLERGHEVSPAATRRALEVTPEGWSMARRAVCACYRTLSCLDHLGADRAIRRSGSHATLGLCVTGLGTRGGEMVVPAAEALLPRLVGTQGFTRAGVEPHRLRVNALVHRLHGQFAEQRRSPGILHLLLLAYDLERRRCPAGTDFDLTSGDLLALASQEADRRYHGAFVRLLLTLEGQLPAGAHVRLADGRSGVVLVPNPDDPLLPRVLVGRQVLTPVAPVSLISPVRHRSGGSP